MKQRLSISNPAAPRTRWTLARCVALSTLLALAFLAAPAVEAQCLTGARNFATIGGQDLVGMGVEVPETHGVIGLEYGRFWQCNDSIEGNNFIPDDPQKKMTPAGTGGCASTDPVQAGGGWWQLSGTTMRGVNGLISGTGCLASSCPGGADLCTIVEDWGAKGVPGVNDTAYFIGWRTDETPPDYRWWDHAKSCGSESCDVPMQQFPVPWITSDFPEGLFTVRSDRDAGANVYVQNPAAGAASELIESYDIMVHFGDTDPGRDRNALCDGNPCWSVLEQVPYANAAMAPTQINIPCQDGGFVAFGLTFVGEGLGGPVPSQLVGRAIPIECVCDDTDGDGFGCGDCDDADDTVYPGAPALCDGINNDCADEAWPNLSGTNEVDNDGDGLSGCNGDCDDTEISVYPGAPQICDRLNNDCNDPSWPVPPTVEIDRDGDGLTECEGDCNDLNAAVFPGAIEVCNGIDDNCNGEVDEDDVAEDSDGDGVGNLCDNCKVDPNPGQENSDNDPPGDACDNCPLTDNEDQADQDDNGIGDVCSLDLSISKDNSQLIYLPGTTTTYTIEIENRAGDADGFDTTVLGPQWSTASSTAEGRIDVTAAWSTGGGHYALWMDRLGTGEFNLNEAVWTVDVRHLTGVELTFRHAEWQDHEHPFAGDFVGSFNADGVAISDDGVNWHPIFDAPDQPDGQWEETTIDLVAAAADAGMTLNEEFRIKFQQYGNGQLSSDGRGWDKIQVYAAGGLEALDTRVEDNFPPELDCLWTCDTISCGQGAFEGDILDIVDMRVGRVFVYTAACDISPTATGPLVNTATITVAPQFTDPDPADNTSTDVDVTGEDTDGDGIPDGIDNCTFDPNPGQEDFDLDGVGDVCDICPQVPNPDQDDSVACVGTVSDGGSCLETWIDLLDGTDSGQVEILDSVGDLFSATPFAGGILPDLIDITSLPAGAGSVCVAATAGTACDAFVKTSEVTVAINGAPCGPPEAVAATELLSDCSSPSGATILLDGTASTDPAGEITSYEWFENFGEPDQVDLGSGATLEVTLPVTVHLITLRVTNPAGESDTDDIVVSYLLDCWENVDSVTIALDKAAGGTRIVWPLVPGATHYDVIRGQVWNMRRYPDRIKLGTVACVRNNVAGGSGTGWLEVASPAPGQMFFYAVRQEGAVQGIYGIGSDVVPRLPDSGDCERN